MDHTYATTCDVPECLLDRGQCGYDVGHDFQSTELGVKCEQDSPVEFAATGTLNVTDFIHQEVTSSLRGVGSHASVSSVLRCQGEENHQQPPLKDTVFSCEHHRQRLCMRWYEPCTCTVCTKCLMDSHSGHQMVGIDDLPESLSLVAASEQQATTDLMDMERLMADWQEKRTLLVHTTQRILQALDSFQSYVLDRCGVTSRQLDITQLGGWRAELLAQLDSGANDYCSTDSGTRSNLQPSPVIEYVQDKTAPDSSCVQDYTSSATITTIDLCSVPKTEMDSPLTYGEDICEVAFVCPLEAEPEHTDTELEFTNTELEVTKTETELTNTELEVTKTEPEVTNTGPEHTNREPELTNTQLEVTETKLEVTQIELDITQIEPTLTSESSQGGAPVEHRDMVTSSRSRETAHSCNVCLRVFRRKCSLIAHVQTHKRGHPEKCANGGKKIKSQSGFNKQKYSTPKSRKLPVAKRQQAPYSTGRKGSPLKTHNNDSTRNSVSVSQTGRGRYTYQCVVCHKMFQRQSELIQHNRVHTEKRTYTCDTCHQTFTSRYHLHKHKMSHKPRKPHVCGICHKEFKRAFNLQRHIVVHTGERPYSCDTCHKTFSQKGDLKTHTTIHTGEIPHVCLVCGKKFTKKFGLQTHIRVHTGEKPYTCLTCSKTFAKKSNLQLHVLSHSRPHVCEVCGKRFARSGYLQIHSRVHTGERPYTCLKCPKTFAWKSSLRLHTQIHSGLKPHLCDVCGKRFAWSGQLKTHSYVHTGERPYTCLTCPKTFAQKSSLQLHALTHSRPHLCEVCGKSFAQSQSLQIHSRVHTGERPYTCLKCPKTFAWKSNLRLHTQIHSGLKPHLCDVCGKRFAQSQSLLRHSRVHTQKKKAPHL